MSKGKPNNADLSIEERIKKAEKKLEGQGVDSGKLTYDTQEAQRRGSVPHEVES